MITPWIEHGTFSVSRRRATAAPRDLKIWGHQGIEPWTSETQTLNHTTRPMPRGFFYFLFYFLFFATLFSKKPFLLGFFSKVFLSHFFLKSVLGHGHLLRLQVVAVQVALEVEVGQHIRVSHAQKGLQLGIGLDRVLVLQVLLLHVGGDRLGHV